MSLVTRGAPDDPIGPCGHPRTPSFRGAWSHGGAQSPLNPADQPSRVHWSHSYVCYVSCRSGPTYAIANMHCIHCTHGMHHFASGIAGDVIMAGIDVTLSTNQRTVSSPPACELAGGAGSWSTGPRSDVWPRTSAYSACNLAQIQRKTNKKSGKSRRTSIF